MHQQRVLPHTEQKACREQWACRARAAPVVLAHAQANCNTGVPNSGTRPAVAPGCLAQLGEAKGPSQLKGLASLTAESEDAQEHTLSLREERSVCFWSAF